MLCAASGLWLLSFKAIQRGRFGCGHFSLVRKQTGQQVRTTCSTNVSDDRTMSSRCNALQAEENSISKAQPVQVTARAKEAVARRGHRCVRHRNESAAAGRKLCTQSGPCRMQAIWTQCLSLTQVEAAEDTINQLAPQAQVSPHAFERCSALGVNFERTEWDPANLERCLRLLGVGIAQLDLPPDFNFS